MVAECPTAPLSAVTKVLNAYSGSSPPAFIEVAITREPGSITTSDGVVTAIKQAAATYTPKLDLASMTVEFQGIESDRVCFVVARLWKAKA